MIEYSETGVTVAGEFVSYEDIDRERNKIRFRDSVLVTITVPYSRDDYEDVFIMDREEWAAHKAKILAHGDIYIGEIAGKHSEVVFNKYSTIHEETDVDKVSAFYERSGWGRWQLDLLERLEEQIEE